jgi:hypothetical protein
MAAIELYTAGGWTHKTTVDDPLFAPILGSMLEDGMTLPDRLELQGSVGETIERDWYLLRELRKWTKWVGRVNMANASNYADMREFIIHGSKSARIVTLDHVVYQPPKKVLWRHELLVLSNILQLPSGWEIHTAVDSRTPLQERIHHMEAMRSIMLSHPRFSHVLAAYITTPAVILYNPSYVEDDKKISILAPFIRNTWLMIRARHIDGDARGVPLTLHTLLLHIDWEAVTAYIDSGAITSPDTAKIRNLAQSMLGKVVKGDEIEFPEIDLTIRSVDQWYDQGRSSIEVRRIIALYTNLLTYMNDDVLPVELGLDFIVGVDGKKMKLTKGIRGLVRKVNYNLLHYIMCSHHTPESRYKNTGGWKGTIILSSEIVVILSKTIGLYAMRRILLSLLHFIAQNESKSKKPSKEGVSQDTIKKKAKLADIVGRANIFAAMLETYLEGKDDAYDGVKSFDITSVVNGYTVTIN